MEQHPYIPDEFFRILGNIVYISNVYDNLLLHIVDYPDKASAERIGFGKKIEDFKPVYDRDFKEVYQKKYSNYDLIKELGIFLRIRNMYVHGIPFMHEGKIASMKISKELIENDYNSTDEIVGFSLQDLGEILKGVNTISTILYEIAGQKNSLILERYNKHNTH